MYKFVRSFKKQQKNPNKTTSEETSSNAVSTNIDESIRYSTNDTDDSELTEKINTQSSTLTTTTTTIGHYDTKSSTLTAASFSNDNLTSTRDVNQHRQAQKQQQKRPFVKIKNNSNSSINQLRTLSTSTENIKKENNWNNKPEEAVKRHQRLSSSSITQITLSSSSSSSSSSTSTNHNSNRTSSIESLTDTITNQIFTYSAENETITSRINDDDQDDNKALLKELEKLIKNNNDQSVLSDHSLLSKSTSTEYSVKQINLEAKFKINENKNRANFFSLLDKLGNPEKKNTSTKPSELNASTGFTPSSAPSISRRRNYLSSKSCLGPNKYKKLYFRLNSYYIVINRIRRLHRTISLVDRKTYDKMVLSDKKKPNKRSILAGRGEHILSSEDELDRNRKGINSSGTKSLGKTVNFRASSLMNNNRQYYHPNHDPRRIEPQHQQRRVNYSLSPSINNSDSFATVISQQPNHNIRINTYNRPNQATIQITHNDPNSSFFAQAIGQGMTSPRNYQPRQPQVQSFRNNRLDQAQRILEIRSEPHKKRLRSPSAMNSQMHRTPSNQNSIRDLHQRDFNCILNLAHKTSHSSRNKLIMNPAALRRSLSVNYLYNKRQTDLRRFQNSAFIEISFKNHAGFTTEDIDDIYMPKQLDLFERKLKASLDLSDNSEQEEINSRRKRFSGFVKSNNRNSRSSRIRTENYPNSKRVKHDYEHQIHDSQQKSYLSEAKRKLEEMKNSKAYYYNLNNKYKSSISNVVKASQDLARNSEIRQRFLGRNLSLHELYDMRRNQIRTAQPTNISYTSDDIDSVYMPWMMENYGRKLAIEALKRRGNMVDSLDANRNQTTLQVPKISSQFHHSRSMHQRNKNKNSNNQSSPYISQYYAQTSDNQTINRNDLWLIDKDIRRYVRKSQQQQQHLNDANNDTEISITDSETSSEDTRPIVPEKIHKPDVSLKNKILKSINKSLLSSELTGIDLNMLKLNDHVRKTLKRIEKRALERDLDLDLIRSFSCSHLADLRKEDIKYTNMKINSKIINHNSYTTEDIQDLYMPKVLETYKLKLAIEKERKGRGYDHQSSTGGGISRTISSHQTPNRTGTSSQSPVRRTEYMDVDQDDVPFGTHLVVSHQPTVNVHNQQMQTIKSPPGKSINSSIASPLSPNIRSNPNNLFRQIIQEKLTEVDQRMAQEMSISTKHNPKKSFKINDSLNEVSESYGDDEDEAASTDRDQDDSLEEYSSDSADDLNLSDHEMKNFSVRRSILKKSSPLSKSKLETTINKSLTLRNPGELISEFYISNMNYAMRYSVEYIQQVAEDLRKRRQQMDAIQEINPRSFKLQRSFSVDRLYAVRKEHIRYSTGADEFSARTNISFTTDDIQDIYMPSAIDNYKRKIAVELERRRRCAENDINYASAKFSDHSPVRMPADSTLNVTLPPVIQQPPVILDDFDIFIIKKTKNIIEDEFVGDKVVKSFQPTIQVSPLPREASKLINQKPIEEKIHIEHANLSREDSNSKNFPLVNQIVPFVNLNRVDVQGPIQIHHSFRVQNKQPPLHEPPVVLDRANLSMENRHGPKKIIETENLALEQANVSFENSSANNFQVTNKVETLFMDSEPMQVSSSSAADDSSLASSVNSCDTFSGINLDNFEPKPVVIERSVNLERANLRVQDPAKLAYVHSTYLDTYKDEHIVVDRANESRVPDLETDVEESSVLVLEKANQKIEPSNLNDKLLIFHPPPINDNDEEDLITDSSRSTGYNLPPEIDMEEIVVETLQTRLEDSRSFSTARINQVRPLNLANQLQQSSSYQYSDFLPPDQTIAYETNYRTTENVLSAQQPSSQRLNILNAPEVKVESMNIQEVKTIPEVPDLPVQNPQYIIEQFAHKPINSTIVFPYEKVGTLETRVQTVEHLKYKEEQAQQVTKGLTSSELVKHFITENPSVQNANLIVDQDKLERIDFESKPVTLNAPIFNDNELVLVPPPRQFQTDHVEIESPVQPAIIPIPPVMEKISRVVVPVNIKKAHETRIDEQELAEFEVRVREDKLENVIDEEEEFEVVKTTEYKNVDVASMKDFDLASVDTFQTEIPEMVNLVERKEHSPIRELASLSKNQVLNLADVALNEQELNYAHPFMSAQPDSQQIHSTETVQTMYLTAEKVVAAFLSLAKEEAIKEDGDRVRDAEYGHANPEVATQVSQEEYLNLRPEIFKIATLNLSMNRLATIEDQSCEDLEEKVNVAPKTSAAVTKTPEDFVQKPPIATKPVLLNKASMNDSIISIESASSLYDAELPGSETALQRQESLRQFEKPTNANQHIKLAMASANIENVSIQTAEQMEIENPPEENIESRNEIGELKSSQNLSINRPVQKLNLAETKSDSSTVDNINDYKSESITIENVNISKEYEADQLARPLSPVELVFRSVESNQDGFLESVKPLDVTEIDFQERISLVSTLISSPPSSKVTIETVQSFNRAHEQSEISQIENCREFILEDLSSTSLETREHIDDLRSPAGVRTSQIERRALGEITSDIPREEVLSEFDSDISALQIPLKQTQPPGEISFLNDSQSQLVYGNPATNQLDIETAQQYQAERVQPERVSFNIEKPDLEHSQNIENVQTLNAPKVSVEEFKEQLINYDNPTLLKDVYEARISVLKNECNLKVGISYKDKFNMASINDNLRENNEYLREIIPFNSEQANLIPYDEKFIIENQITTIKVDSLARGQEIIDINQENMCEDAEFLNDSLNIKQSVANAPPFQERASTSVNFIQNYPTSGEIQLENCDSLTPDQVDYFRPVLNREQSFDLNKSIEYQEQVLTRPQSFDIELTLETLQVLDTRTSFETAKLEKQSSDLNLIERSGQVAVLNLPNQNDIDLPEENLREFVENKFAELPNLSRENTLSTNIVIKSNDLNLFNAPRVETLDEPMIEISERITIQENESRLTIKRETNVDEIVSVNNSVRPLMRECESQLEEEFVEEFMQDLQKIAEAPSSSKERPIDESAVRKIISCLNAPKVENIEDLDEFVIEKVQGVSFTPDQVIINRVASLDQTIVIEKPVKPLAKETHNIMPEIPSEKLNDFHEENLIQTTSVVKQKGEEVTCKKIETKTVNYYNAPKQEDLDDFELERADMLNTNEDNMQRLIIDKETFVSEFVNLKNPVKPILKEEENWFDELNENSREFLENIQTEKPSIQKEMNKLSTDIVQTNISFLNAPRIEQFSRDTINERADAIYIRDNFEQANIKREEGVFHVAEVEKPIRKMMKESEDKLDDQFDDNLKELHTELRQAPEIKFKREENPLITIETAQKVTCLNAPLEMVNSINLERVDTLYNASEPVEHAQIDKERIVYDKVEIKNPIKPMLKESQKNLDDEIVQETIRELNESKDDLLEQVEVKREISSLKNNPDKHLLLWLNYPKISNSQTEINFSETRSIDEKLDYLYERIRMDRHNDPNLETDANIIHIERALSLFLSNQEKVEYQNEILRYLPITRPELENLIMNKHTNFDLENELVITRPVELMHAYARNNDIIFEEDSIEEFRNEREKYTSSTTLSIKKEIDLLNLVKKSKVDSFSLAITREDDVKSERLGHLRAENDQEVTVIKINREPFNQAYTNQDQVAWETTEDRSSSQRLARPTDKIAERLVLETITQHEIQIGENAQILNDHEWMKDMKSLEPRTSTSMDLDNINCASQINYNCDTKSLSEVYWDQEELDDYLIMNKHNITIDNGVSKIEITNSLNIVEHTDPRFNATDETTLSINSDEEINSFFEQVEKLEIITNNEITNRIDKIGKITTYNCANLLNQSLEEENTLIMDESHKRDDTFEVKNSIKFTIEQDSLNKLVQQTEIPNWEQFSCFKGLVMDPEKTTVTTVNDPDSFIKPVEINISKSNVLNDSISETSSTSDGSSKVHLIESVEIVTHHNNLNDTSSLNEHGDCNFRNFLDENGSSIHIHKVDINRLKIREKPGKAGTGSNDNPEDAKPKYKVDFNQEELVDLRNKPIQDQTNLDNSSEETNKIDINTDKIFARKFVEQVIQLSSRKLADIDHRSEYHEESLSKYENMNFNKIASKSTSEILKSLSNLKSDIGKHLTDSVVEKVKSSECFDTNEFLISEQIANDTQNLADCSLKEAQDEEFFDNLTNRLHSSSNYGNNSSYLYEKYEEEIIQDNSALEKFNLFERSDIRDEKDKHHKVMVRFLRT